jgi:hypothetical protein
MLTLQEILERETRVLLDNSAFGFYNDINAQLLEKSAEKVLDTVLPCNYAYILPETLAQINGLKRALNSGQKTFRERVRKYQRSELFSDIKGTYEEICKKLRCIKRFISEMKGKVLDIDDNILYLQFVNFVCYLENTFRVKKNRNPCKRTDEKVVAAALFLTAYGKGSTAVVTGDSDITRLLKCSFDFFCMQDFSHQTERVSQGLRQGINLYFRVPETQTYEARFNSLYHEIRNRGLTIFQREAIRRHLSRLSPAA